MLGKHPLLVLLPTLFVVTTACHDIHTTGELQRRQINASRRNPVTYRNYMHMVDNAILRDMSVADIHFVRHTSEVSGIGEARLNRLAKLLNTYGGIVRYETELDDEALIQQRLGRVREYLALSGCDMDRVEVAQMISGGRGMPGDEAVEKFIKGTGAEQEAGSSTLLPGGFSER